jgi:hypothetical protein
VLVVIVFGSAQTRRIIDLPNYLSCDVMSGTALGRGQKWSGLNFKRLGKVRVIIFENIFAIILPVDLLSYVFGRWCGC